MGRTSSPVESLTGNLKLDEFLEGVSEVVKSPSSEGEVPQLPDEVVGSPPKVIIRKSPPLVQKSLDMFQFNQTEGALQPIDEIFPEFEQALKPVEALVVKVE